MSTDLLLDQLGTLKLTGADKEAFNDLIDAYMDNGKLSQEQKAEVRALHEKYCNTVKLTRTINGKPVTLLRQGIKFSTRCPFHEEITPSFIMEEDQRTYHCFGCGVRGEAHE